MTEQQEPIRYSMIIEWEPIGEVFVVTVPELPGCRTHGRTYKEAVAQGQDAIESWVDAMRDWDREVPPPRFFDLAFNAVEDEMVLAQTWNEGSASPPTTGSHTVWAHPSLPAVGFVISGDDDDDALPYQESDLQAILAKVRRHGTTG